jgi:hypothetical protein
MSIKTTGDLRDELAKAFGLAMKGQLSSEAARAVIGCANQININIGMETKARAQLIREGKATEIIGEFGALYLNK